MASSSSSLTFLTLFITILSISQSAPTLKTLSYKVPQLDLNQILNKKDIKLDNIKPISDIRIPWVSKQSPTILQLQQQQQTVSSTIVDQFIYNFLDGFDFHTKINSSSDCFVAVRGFTARLLTAADQLVQGDYFEGYFNVTKSLTYMTNVTRHCYSSIVEANTQVVTYLDKFGTFDNYAKMVQDGFLGNFHVISMGYSAVRKAIEVGDWPAVGKGLGQVLYGILNVNPPRTLLQVEDEDLQQSNERVLQSRAGRAVITTAENFFTRTVQFLGEILFHSNIVSTSSTLNQCTDSLILFNNKMGEVNDKFSENRSGSEQEGLFLFFDSLGLIHPVSWNCYNLGVSIRELISNKFKTAFDYEEMMLNIFFYQNHIRIAYYKAKDCVFSQSAINYSCLGEEIGDVIQYIFFNKQRQ